MMSKLFVKLQYPSKHQAVHRSHHLHGHFISHQLDNNLLIRHTGLQVIVLRVRVVQVVLALLCHAAIGAGHARPDLFSALTKPLAGTGPPRPAAGWI